MCCVSEYTYIYVYIQVYIYMFGIVVCCCCCPTEAVAMVEQCCKEYAKHNHTVLKRGCVGGPAPCALENLLIALQKNTTHN